MKKRLQTPSLHVGNPNTNWEKDIDFFPVTSSTALNILDRYPSLKTTLFYPIYLGIKIMAC